MSPDDSSDALRRAYGDASMQVDDAPDPRVRAAVLAAAARETGARPLLAAVNSSTRRYPARRWPLSAAALLLVSVMTGLVATHALRDEPERVTTVASASRTIEAAKPGDAMPSSDAKPEDASPAAPIDARRPAEPQRNTPSAAPIHREKVRPPSRVEGTRPTPPVAPPPTSAVFVAPPPAPAVSMPSQTRGKAEALAADSERATSSSRMASVPSASSPAASPTRAANAARAPGRSVEPATPEAWVERIVGLRADGNDSEADRELDALRQRYPGFEVPATALRSTGTR